MGVESNRTKVELKLSQAIAPLPIVGTSNRTKVELKPGFGGEKSFTFFGLIEPKWN